MEGLDEPTPLKARRLLSKWLERCCQNGIVRHINFQTTASSILGLLRVDIMMNLLAREGQNQESGHIVTCVKLLWNGMKPESSP